MNYKMKRHLKTIGLCVLASAMTSILAGCEGSGDSKGTIAVIVKSQGVDYWDSVHAGAEDAANETGYEVYYDAPETEDEVNVQEDLVKSAVEKNVKAIVIAPLDPEALNDELALANDAGIPVICLDSDCTFEEKKVFIASNNANAGSIEGRKAGDILVKNGGGTVAIVGHAQIAGNIKGRVGGFIDTLVGSYGASVEDLSPSSYISADDISYNDAVKLGKEVAEEKGYPEIRIVDLQYCDSKRDKAKDITKSIVSKNPGLSMIYASNQTANLGVLDALKENGKAGSITVMGFDSGDEQIEALQAGIMEGFITQSPYNMGYLGIRYANKCINNEKIPSLVDTGVTYVDADNLMDEDVQLLLNPNVFEGGSDNSSESSDGGENAAAETAAE